MLKKLNYRPVIEYGVLTSVRRNSIVLEGADPVTGFDTAVNLQRAIKEQQIPTQIGKDLYRQIPDIDNLKAFCRDQKIDKQVDLRKSLEVLRADVIAIMEPTKEELTDEKLVIESDSRLLN